MRKPLATPPILSDVSLFYTYVGFYSGEAFPKDAPECVMFYKYSGDALVILKQEKGVVEQVIAPHFIVELHNPTGKYQELLRVGFESDGYHLVDARRGNWIGNLTGEDELNYEYLLLEPNLHARKILAFLWSKTQSATPYILFPETFAPSMFAWVNYMDEWIAPQKEPTVIGVGVTVNSTLNRLKLPTLPERLITSNLKELTPIGTTRLATESIHSLELLLQEEPLPFSESLEKEFPIPKRVTHKITQKELMRIVQQGQFSIQDSRRYEIQTKKFDSNKILLVFSLGQLYVHILHSGVKKPTVKNVRKALSLDRRIPIVFLEPPEILE